jgi:hypothetical protein
MMVTDISEYIKQGAEAVGQKIFSFDWGLV